MGMDEASFSSRLVGGERLVWSGRPQQGLMLSARDVFLIPFSLLWAGFAVFWEASVARDGAPAFFVLWGLPFLVVGAYVTVGRFVHDAWIRARTRYALTDRRALILRGGQLTSIDLKRVDAVSVSGSGSGRGTIEFGRPQPLAFRGSGLGIWTPSRAGDRFVGVENANSLFTQIETFRAAA
jgi:hypothetical protein